MGQSSVFRVCKLLTLKHKVPKVAINSIHNAAVHLLEELFKEGGEASHTHLYKPRPPNIHSVLPAVTSIVGEATSIIMDVVVPVEHPGVVVEVFLLRDQL